MFNLDDVKKDWKIYCLDENEELIDNDLMLSYEINHNGIYVPLVEIREGSCSGCEELDYYIVDNDFYNDTTDYVIKVGSEQYLLPVGDDSELIFFDLGVKILKVNNRYKFIYGVLDYGQFHEFDSYYNLDISPFQDLILKKMKKIVKSW